MWGSGWQVNDWLVTVLEHMGPDLFRYKGILAIEGVDEQYVFQVSILHPFPL